MDWNVIGPLVGALIGVVGAAIYNTMKHRSEVYHNLRVAQFEAVKELAIEMQKQVLFRADGNPVVELTDPESLESRLEEGLPKVAPLVSLTEYSLIDREVLVQWERLSDLIQDLIMEEGRKKEGTEYVTFGQRSLPETSVDAWVALAFAVEHLVESARNAVLPPRSSALVVRDKLSPSYSLYGPRGRVVNFFWRLRGRASVAGKKIVERGRRRKGQ